MENIKAGLSAVRDIEEIKKKLAPYKPEIKNYTIDYVNRISEIKLLLTIPDSIKRQFRKAEIPCYYGYQVSEMYDGSFNRLDSLWQTANDKHILETKNLPKSEKFFVILQGGIRTDALKRLVAVNAPRDPSKEGDVDKYWLHSAIKDLSIIENMWDSLDVENVNINIRVRLQRCFAAAMPEKVKEKLEKRQELIDAVDSKNRNRLAIARARYQRVKTTAQLPRNLITLVMKMVSGEFFDEFVHVDKPFTKGSIDPVGMTSLIPENIGVNVLTELNFKNPVAKGNLVFEREEYRQVISKQLKKSLK